MRTINQHLFPQFASLKMHDEGKKYLQTQLVRLIESGELYLTEILLQRPIHVSDVVGEIVFGMARDETFQNWTRTWPTPRAIMDARVYLESCEYDPADPVGPKPSDRPIAWKDGVREEANPLLTAALQLSHSSSSPLSNQVDNIKTRPSAGEFALRDAWQILKQRGFGVVPAARADHRKRAWLVREVPPEELAARAAQGDEKPRARAGK